MLPRSRLRKRLNRSILLAILFQAAFIWQSITFSGLIVDAFTILLALISLGFWIAASSYLAQIKGYSKWWGAAGILSCLGLLLLMILPNRLAALKPPADYHPGDYPRPNG
jgi:hypothetical protein